MLSGYPFPPLCQSFHLALCGDRVWVLYGASHQYSLAWVLWTLYYMFIPPRIKFFQVRHLDLSISTYERNGQIGPCVTLVLPATSPRT